jgi:nucleotide-binding universal stress UspA family protein
MGAYGHSRLAEAIFGGVTKRLLDESPVPLFLVH